MSIRSSPFESQSQTRPPRLEAILRAGKAQADAVNPLNTSNPYMDVVFANPDLVKELMLQIAFADSETVCDDVLSICSARSGFRSLCDEAYFRLALSAMGIKVEMGEEDTVPWGKNSWKTCFIQACSTFRHLILKDGVSKIDFLKKGGFYLTASSPPGNLTSEGRFNITEAVRVAMAQYWIHPGFGPITYWNTEHVDDMSFLFNLATNFNQPLKWNTSEVKSMESMFRYARSFNQPIGEWDVRNVVNASSMFDGAIEFDKPLEWRTERLVDASHMFRNATRFNQSIGGWDVSKVETFRMMFYGARKFNQPIGEWKTGKAKDMGHMFAHASSFNQDLEKWNTSTVMFWYGMVGMFERSGMKTIPDWYKRKAAMEPSLYS